MSRLAPYVVRRCLAAALLVFLVTSGAVILAHLAPGDVTSELVAARATPEEIARERARLGLDRPLVVQYLEWAGRAVRLDLGESWRYGRPVRGLVAERAANTALLALAALALATLVGLPLGVWTGSRSGGLLPGLVRAGSAIGLSVPPLLMSLLLAVAAARTGWLPVGGMRSPGAAGLGWLGSLGDLAGHLAVPALALALPLAAVLERLQAQAMRETLGEPFVLAALARGVPRRRIVWRGALRIAVRPVVALYGLIVGGLLSGSFAVEIVTAWPGLGQLTYEALLARDVQLVAGCAAAGSIVLAAGTLASDVALAVADPRVGNG